MNAQDSQLLPLPKKSVKVTGECWWVVHFSLVEKKSSMKLWRSKWCKNPPTQNEGSAHKMMGTSSAHKMSDHTHKMVLTCLLSENCDPVGSIMVHKKYKKYTSVRKLT